MKKRNIVGIILMAVAMLGAACGSPAPVAEGDDDPTSAETAPEGTEDGTGAAAEADCPIRIGASLSLTGTYARTAADQQASYELFVSQVNEEGGLLGCDVELTVYDDESTPETGARLYQRLITQDQVDLLIGPYSSAVSGAVMPITDRHEMATVFPMAASDDLFDQGFEWAFQVITPASKYVDGIIDIMQDEGLERIAYMGSESSYPITLRDTLEAGQEEFGYELSHVGLWPPGTTDFSTLVARAGQSDPDVIIGATAGSDESILFARALEEQGVEAPIIVVASGGAEPDFQEALQRSADHIMASTHWEPGIETPGGAEFTSAYTEKTDREPGYHAATSYAGMEILAEAVRSCGCLDQAQIRQAIIDMETETVFGGFDVDEDGAQLAKSSFILQWIDGEKVLVWPSEVAEQEPVVPHPGWQ